LPLEVDEGDGDVLTYLDVEGHHVATFLNGALTPVDSDGRNTELRHGTQDLGLATAFGEGTTSPADSDERFLFAMLESVPSATEVQFARRRTYDPTTGRFLEADPIGAAGGIEIYQYGGGDPINFVDPMGFAATGSDCTPGAGGSGSGGSGLPPRTYEFESSWIPATIDEQIASSGLGLAAYVQSLAGASKWILDIDDQPNFPGTGPLCVVNCAEGSTLDADGYDDEERGIWEEDDFVVVEITGDPGPGTGKDKRGKKGGGWLKGIGEWFSDHFSGGPTGQGSAAIAEAFESQQQGYDRRRDERTSVGATDVLAQLALAPMAATVRRSGRIPSSIDLREEPSTGVGWQQMPSGPASDPDAYVEAIADINDAAGLGPALAGTRSVQVGLGVQGAATGVAIGAVVAPQVGAAVNAAVATRVAPQTVQTIGQIALESASGAPGSAGVPAVAAGAAAGAAVAAGSRNAPAPNAAQSVARTFGRTVDEVQGALDRVFLRNVPRAGGYRHKIVWTITAGLDDYDEPFLILSANNSKVLPSAVRALEEELGVTFQSVTGGGSITSSFGSTN
jgi:RHS repeat-associated protein